MGVSFKVARVGSRWIPPPIPSELADGDAESAPLPGDGARNPPRISDHVDSLLGLDDGLDCFSDFTNKKGNKSLGTEHVASFSLNLYPDGFIIGKPTEGMMLPLLEDIPKLLHPYDRASKTLFSAIEDGWLPGDILDDMPCKYYNGTLFCEVWDFRSCMSKLGHNERDFSHGKFPKECDSSRGEFPKVQKVCLRMGTENVVKDMQSISDDSWSYNDLLQVESRIIKSLQPKLYLCPKPSLDRLCRTPAPKKLDLGIFRRRLTRRQHDKHGIDLKPVSIGISSSRIIENLEPQNGSPKHGTLCYAQNTSLRSMPFVQPKNDQDGIYSLSVPNAAAMVPEHNPNTAACLLPVSKPAAMVPEHNPKDSFLQTRYCVTLGKRNRLRTESARSTDVKRPKKGPPVLDPPQSKMDALPGQEEQRRAKFSQKKCEVQVSQHVQVSKQHHYPLTSEASTINIPEIDVQMTSLQDEDAERGIVKEDPSQPKVLYRADVGKDKKENLVVDIKSKISKKQLSIQRSMPPHLQCNNGPSIVKHPKKENASRKRKSAQGSQGLAESSGQFPVSQLDENQRMSSGTPKRTCLETDTIRLQKEDGVVAPVASVETSSMVSGSNCSFIQENGIVLKKKPEALCLGLSEVNKGMSFEGSASATCAQDRSNSTLARMLPASIPSEANNDAAILERFSKIEKITQRYGLSRKKYNHDNYVTRKAVPCSFLSPVRFLMAEDSEEIGGSRNAWKIRILTYGRFRFFFAGNSLPFLASESWCKLVLTRFDEPHDHKIGAEIIYVTEEKHFHTALLPTPQYADLFAAQFTSLMERDGYVLINDQLKHSSSNTSDSSVGKSIHIGSSGVPMLPYATANIDQSSRTVSPVDNISTMHLHNFPHRKTLPPTKMTSSLSGPQWLEVSSDRSFMQEQIPHGWGSMPLHDKPLDHVAMPNSPAHLSLVHLQQSQQQLQRILQSKVASGGEAHLSSMKLRQFSGFNNPCSPLSYGGTTPPTQAVDLPKLRQAQGLGMEVDQLMKHMSNRSGMMVNGPLLDHALGINNAHPFQGGGKSPLLFNKPLVDLFTNAYHQQHQLHVQNSLLHNLQHQQHLHLGSPEHQNLPGTSRMREPSSVSQRFPRVAGRQVLSGIAGSPQLSSPTVGSGGSISSSPVEFGVAMKEDDGGKDAV